MSNIDRSPGYELKPEQRDGYLYFCVESDAITYEVAREYWDEIVEICRTSKLRRLLLHKRIHMDLSLSDLYQLASGVAAEIPGYKLAIFDEFTPTQITEFGELVSSNRGLNMKCFKDLDEAEAWLLEK